MTSLDQTTQQILKARDLSLEEYHQGSTEALSDFVEHAEPLEVPFVLKRARGFQENPTLDKLIDDGAHSLRQMGAIVHLSRQTILNYINYIQQHGEWTSRRIEFQNLERELKRLYRTDMVTVLKRKEEDLDRKKRFECSNLWAYSKAHEYVSLRPRTSYSFDFLYTIFDIYKKTKDSSNKSSLEEIAKSLREIREEFNTYPAVIGKVLHTVGLKPFYHTTSMETVKAIERGFNLTFLSHIDIAYFLGVSERVVIYNFRKKGSRHKMNILKNSPKLSFNLLSQIYEAKYAGLNDQEISEYVGTTRKKVQFAINNILEYEPLLIGVLIFLYDSKNIDKPYPLITRTK